MNDLLAEIFRAAIKFNAGGMANFWEEKLLSLIDNQRVFAYFKLSFELPSWGLRRKALRSKRLKKS